MLRKLTNWKHKTVSYITWCHFFLLHIFHLLHKCISCMNRVGVAVQGARVLAAGTGSVLCLGVSGGGVVWAYFLQHQPHHLPLCRVCQPSQGQLWLLHYWGEGFYSSVQSTTYWLIHNAFMTSWHAWTSNTMTLLLLTLKLCASETLKCISFFVLSSANKHLKQVVSWLLKREWVSSTWHRNFHLFAFFHFCFW